MVQIVGKYQFVSSENFEDFIKNLDKELANAFLHTTPIVEVQQNDDQWVIAVFDQDKLFGTTNSFTLGEVYDEQLLAKGLTFKSVTTKEGNSLKTETDLPANLKAVRVYEFIDTGMIVHVSCNKSDIKAKRIYKRL